MVPLPLKSVLVVEDNLAAREGYCEMLQNAGFEVIAVESGEVALTLASPEAFAAIVLDLDLPDVDGWEVARRLQADPRTRDIPIICVSGHTRQSEQASSLRAGCSVFLPKPLVPGDLLKWIDRLSTPAAT